MLQREPTRLDTLLPMLRGTVHNTWHGGASWWRTLARDLWYTAMRHGSTGIRNTDLRIFPGLADVIVQGYLDGIDESRQIIAALCALFGCRTFFEIGTLRGQTTYTVARTNPQTQVYTLDLPSKDAAQKTELVFTDHYLLSEWDSGGRIVGTREEDRIERLFGDTATFDFSPYRRAMDMVYIDGSHSYSYVKNDTEKALAMLSDTGTIIWDDYPRYPQIYLYLQELAPTLDRPIFHIDHTRLAFYSRHRLVPHC